MEDWARQQGVDAIELTIFEFDEGARALYERMGYDTVHAQKTVDSIESNRIERTQLMEWKLEVVVVPVSDVDRAKRFYADQVGFNVDVDRTFSDRFRVVQLTPPGSGCSISFGTGLSSMEPGSLKGMQLVVSDVAAARAQLTERGVDVSPVQHFEDGELADGPGEDWNSFIFFDDPDGNSWTVQERPPGESA